MRHIMDIHISGTANGHDWPKRGEDAPAWLGEDELRHMVALGQVRIAVAPEPEVSSVKPEISRPVAPEQRARARRTKAGG